MFDQQHPATSRSSWFCMCHGAYSSKGVVGGQTDPNRKHGHWKALCAAFWKGLHFGRRGKIDQDSCERLCRWTNWFSHLNGLMLNPKYSTGCYPQVSLWQDNFLSVLQTALSSGFQEAGCSRLAVPAGLILCTAGKTCIGRCKSAGLKGTWPNHLDFPKVVGCEMMWICEQS